MFNPGRIILEFFGAIARDVRNVFDQNSDNAATVGAVVAPRSHEIPPGVRVVTLSDLIMELGAEVTRAFPEMTERQRQFVEAILQVEHYCKLQELDKWEAEVMKFFDDDVAEGSLGELLEEIVQLGRGQLYCGYSRQYAYDDYQVVRAAWRALRTTAPEDAVADCWCERK
ncbi:MAG: hypothetical protein H6819_05990 [Phycisphaerales bacterium]|nr:hypothetical protein [Phycisphaerales bacterium]MCB9858628.1 hypothetical protein [Phycisphaerales bacterium]